jgi:hypothetical protein
VPAAGSLVRIAHEFVDATGWRGDGNVLAVFIIGSVAEQRSDDASDLDLVVVNGEVPGSATRLAAYEQAGCRDVKVDFFSCQALALRCNVGAVDKLSFAAVPIDVAYCLRGHVGVYSYLNIVPLIWSDDLPRLPGPQSAEGVPPAEIRARLDYDLRIMRVHAERYRRWSERRNWLAIDLSMFLRAARDVVLVTGGYWRYNEFNNWMWENARELGANPNGAIGKMEAIKTLDDRLHHAEKAALMQGLVDDLSKRAEAYS